MAKHAVMEKHVVTQRHEMSEKQASPTRNDLPADARARLVELLNARLADLADLKSQTKQAHWNVKGPGFYSLHLLFDQIAEEIEEHVDTVAERAVQLGGRALGTARLAAKHSTLPEYPLEATEQRAHVEAMTERLALAAAAVRKGIDRADELGDRDTADLFTAVSRTLDKSLWFVESHLQGR
jgi:starvation-inducible DNA-binding protein